MTKTFNTGVTLTESMLEEAIKIAESNFGRPDCMHLSDDSFTALKQFFDPEYHTKNEFNIAMEKMLWPDRFPKVYQWQDLVKASGAV